MSLLKDLNQFHSPGNRFVYYPTTNHWNNEAKDIFKESILETDNTNLYIHLPFCRELCTFCGCNIKISKKKEEHLDYIETIVQEFKLKTSSFRPIISTLTIGGGTPNILHPEAKNLLKSFLIENVVPTLIDSHVELEPKTFNQEDYQYFKSIGINRFSFGIQDFSKEICENLNRHQTIEEVFRAINHLGDEDGLGLDLIWGLPKQTIDTVKSWKAHLKELSPDWISFYPLAKVPWLKSYQNAYGDFTLPTLEEKFQLYVAGIRLFEELNYIHFGFGHFIKKEGHFKKALEEQALTRRVSGLYPREIHHTLALGVGAISEINNSLHQNYKILERYRHSIAVQNIIPTEKAHLMNAEDIARKELMEQIIHKNIILPHEYQLIENKFPKGWFNKNQDNHSLTAHGRHFLGQVLKELT
ncbi:MAG: radical SAM protein [Bacteriovoracaceae bacterium]|nr:radical SAM protein [Bacteriovoracaceae bacterium]